MKAYIILAVFTLISCVSANITAPISVPRLPVPHYFNNGTVAWFPKVAGGHRVNLGDVDGIVSIQTRTGNHFCSGTLVLFDLVLTSAECVTDPIGVKLDVSHFRIIADDLGIFGQANKTRQIASVSRVHIHPRYNPYSANFDIAILELDRPFSRTPTLRFNNVTSQIVKETTKCQVAGWGSVSQNFTVHLHRVELEVADIQVANGTQFYNGLIPTGAFAARSINRNGTCLGDPGTALICDNHISGILSFGYGCSRSDFPLVFTQAALSYRWVNDIIRNVTTISPAAAGEFVPFGGAQTYFNYGNSTNGTFFNGTTNGTTTRRPGRGGAGSMNYSIGLLIVSLLQFLLIQNVMKLIH